MPNWNEVLKEIGKITTDGKDDEGPFDVVRRRYLGKLHFQTDRNVIAYYSGFLHKPKIDGVDISDDDKNGMMLCVHQMDRRKGLDLFLHTPGGDVAATESLVHYLGEMFDGDVRAIVPQIAMSAGTMIACACKEIIMGKHSNIGPVDPQFNGIPAIGVIKEVEAAFHEIQQDQRAAYVWNPILSRLPPSFLQQCHWAIERSEAFLRDVLSNGMLKDVPEPEKTQTINRVVEKLTDLTENKAHNRHLHWQACRAMGLKVTLLEEMDGTMQDLVLTVHHCYMHTLSNTPAFKIIENHMGRAHVRLLQTQQNQILLQLPQPSPAAGGPAE